LATRPATPSHYLDLTGPHLAHPRTRSLQLMAKVESTDDNLYDGLYGDEFEEDFAVSALGNPSTITDSNADDGATEFLEPPEDPLSAAPEAEEAAQPIPTLDSSKLRTNADALPPKPNAASNNGASLSYSAQVAEQFSSAYRQTPSQERGRLDAARLAQFNQTGGAPSGSTGASLIDGQARPVRPSEMKDEGCVFRRSFILYSIVLYLKGGVCAVPFPLSLP
jgi:hypothetical protein